MSCNNTYFVSNRHPRPYIHVGEPGEAAVELNGPAKVGPVEADGTARVQLLMSLPRQGQIKVAGTLTCQLAEVSFLLQITCQRKVSTNAAATAKADLGGFELMCPAVGSCDGSCCMNAAAVTTRTKERQKWPKRRIALLLVVHPTALTWQQCCISPRHYSLCRHMISLCTISVSLMLMWHLMQRFMSFVMSGLVQDAKSSAFPLQQTGLHDPTTITVGLQTCQIAARHLC